MIVFSSILARHGLKKHDGRSLWEYRCTPEEYHALKETVGNYLAEGKLRYVGPDAALFVSEWWRTEYAGGTPSWDELARALGRDPIHFRKPLENACKYGGNALRLNWITLSNIQYLRTLFVEGGFPLKRVCLNYGNFASFFTCLLEKMQQYGEDQVTLDWLKSSHIVNYLPRTFRNDVIYTLAIKTISAILSGDKLPFDHAANVEIGRLVKNLKEAKNRKRDTGGIGLKIQWELDIEGEEGYIFYRPVADRILTGSFLFRNKIPAEATDLRFFANSEQVARYRKNSAGELVIYSTNIKRKKRGQTVSVDCYASNAGHMVQLHTPGQDGPETFKPQLLNYTSDSSFSFALRNTTGHSSAALLLPTGWRIDAGEDGAAQKSMDITLCGRLYTITAFEGKVRCVCDNEEMSFFTSVIDEEEHVLPATNCPAWVLDSSKPMLVGEIAFRLLGENGASKVIDPRNIFWRMARSAPWCSLASATPDIGRVEFKIRQGQATHFSQFFCIGNTEVECLAYGARKGRILIRGYAGLVRLDESLDDKLMYDISKTSDLTVFDIGVKQGYSPPGKMKLRFETANSRRAVDVEITPPFRGAYFADAEGKILRSHSRICVHALAGYRLVCVGEVYKLLISASGSNRELSKVTEIGSGSFPLFKYEEEICNLFGMYVNPIDSENVIRLDVLDEGGGIAAGLQLGKYNCFTTDGVPFEIHDQNSNSLHDTVYPKAFYLGDMGDYIQETMPAYENGSFTFPPVCAEGPWILYCEDGHAYNLRPTLKINGKVNPQHFEGPLAKCNTIPDSNERREAVEQLLMNEPFDSSIWREVVSYHRYIHKHFLPANVLDYFKVIADSPPLAVKLFFAIQLNTADASTTYSSLMRMEESLPFAWHMIAAQQWHNGLNELRQLPDIIFNKMLERLCAFLEEQFTNDAGKEWSKLVTGLIYNPAYNVKDPGTMPPEYIHELRIRMKEKSNWPKEWYPGIPEEWRELFPVKGKYEKYQWAVLLAPFHAALTIAGKTPDRLDGIQKKKMQWYRGIAQDWYVRAMTHLLKRILAR